MQGKPSDDVSNQRLVLQSDTSTTFHSEIAASDSTTTNPKASPEDGSWWASSLSLLTLLGIFVLLVRSISRKHQGKYLSVSRQSPQIPCQNCRFYNKNPYIKCAVHPHTASTKEATDCTDYWPCDSNRFSQESKEQRGN